MNGDTGIYITYNLGQHLSFDREYPHIAVLLRVLLRHEAFGVSNVTCDRAFSEHAQVLAHIGPLEDFVVWYFSKPRIENEAKPKHVVVCVDEVCRLMNGTDNSVVQAVTWALEELAFGLEKRAVTCTVIVSALTDDAFATVTGRPVHKIFLPLPCDAARDFIVGNLLPRASDHEKAMIAACAGTHLRSIVVACNCIAMKGALDVRALAVELHTRIAAHLCNAEKVAIQSYVRGCCQNSTAVSCVNAPAAKRFMDNVGCIAPPMVCFAFEQDFWMPSWAHPAQSLFQSSYCIVPSKQLEHCGYHYDRFRALYGLPVVPYGVKVCNCGTLGTAWFKELTFLEEIAYEKNLDTSSLFAVKGMSVVRTKHKLEFGKYLLPDVGNHPYIDRACLAVHRASNTQCVVLYQDKINTDGMPAAVAGAQGGSIRSSERNEHPCPLRCASDRSDCGHNIAKAVFSTPTFSFVTTRSLGSTHRPSLRRCVLCGNDILLGSRKLMCCFFIVYESRPGREKGARRNARS